MHDSDVWRSAAHVCVASVDDERGKQQDGRSVPAYDVGCAPQVPQWTHQQSQREKRQGHLARDLLRGVHILSVAEHACIAVDALQQLLLVAASNVVVL